MLARARSMLGKGQIYLPREGFKRAHSWAEGVVSERVLEAESQQKKVEQLVLNLLFHPQLKQYIRSGTWYSRRLLYPQNFLDTFMGQRAFIFITPSHAVQCSVVA